MVSGGDEFDVIVVGGRTLNQEIGDGEEVEAGGQWIGPTHDRLAALAAELGVATFPTFDDGEHLVEAGGEVRRYTGSVPKLPPHALADFAQAAFRLDRLARTVPTAAPWAARRAASWDAQTFATWLRRNLRTTSTPRAGSRP